MCYGINPTVTVTNQVDRRESRSVRHKSFQDKRVAQIDQLNRKAAFRAARTEDSYTERNLKVGELVLRHSESRTSKLHPQ